MMKKKQNPQVIFANIKQENQPYVIQSLCTQCQNNGKTTILLTKIPFFREIYLASFQCQHCGNRNNEVQFAGKLPDFGVEIMFVLMNKSDLNREVIKSEYAQIYFDELDLEIPSNKKALITTIQSILTTVIEQLTFNQPVRKINEPQQYEKIEQFIKRVQEYKNGNKFPLTMKIIDPSGNSNIKNPFAPKLDKNLHKTNIHRTLDQLVEMGYNIENAKQQIKQAQQHTIGQKMNFTKPFEEENILNNQPVMFEVPCHSCTLPGQMRMCQVSVPYFTDLIIMSFTCENCGAHTAQIKNSGEIRQQACQITLNYDGNQQDLKRDLFKSETCKTCIPEVELQLDYGTLGGVFTTVQGLLEKIHDHLNENNPFVDSDSQFRARIEALLTDVNLMRQGTKKFTLILIDPLAHSFIQDPYFPEKDPRITRVFRKRTEQEDDNLGITDMKVQNYQKKEQSPQQKKQQNKVQEPTASQI